jgi:hypothetical protein
VAVVNGQIFTYCARGASSLDGESVLDLLPNKRTVWVNLYPKGYITEAAYHETQMDADEYASTGRIGDRAYPVEIDE